MVVLVVDGINDEIGPGDIVGAFAHEARIDGKRIGKITLKGEQALVEIEREVAEKVIEVMDGNQVGGVPVEVYPRNAEDLMSERVAEYVQKYSQLVELERKEEMDRHLQEIKYLSGREREDRGRAVLHLRGRDEGEGYGGKYLIKFVRQQPGEELPETEIQVGDLVMLSRSNPLDKNNPTGTLVEKTRYSMTVVFDEKPPPHLYKKFLRLDLFVNDITFQRMLDTLELFGRAEGRLAELRDILLGERRPVFEELPEIETQQSWLNDSQKEAVRKALAARDVFLIHGPPGTGKTVTCIELILQEVKRNKRIIATADSNTAVDNLVERLVGEGTRVVRVGHPARVTPLLREHTLDYLIMENSSFKKARELREEAYRLIDEQDELTHPGGRWRRGMSDQEIKKLARNNRSARGVPREKIGEMARWLKIQQRIDGFFKKIERLEAEAAEELLTGADVICTTNSTAGAEILAGYGFDLVVIDEATQAAEPAALIPLIRGKKVVMAGDHRQLPPTILNRKAEKGGLARSLFERLLSLYGDDIRGLLKVQYRMHQLIMEFPNREFYDGELTADPAVAEQKLAELGVELSEGRTPPERAFGHSPISFLDTRNLSAPERSRGGSFSFENPVEANLVRECLEAAEMLGIEGADIAVISPYKDQIDLIRERYERPGLEIDTVDGFQGREKEVIIFSAVRSNPEHNMGFLRDLRRLNVSLTRARKRLIIIGDSETLSTHETYRRLLEYVKDKGYYYLL